MENFKDKLKNLVNSSPFLTPKRVQSLKKTEKTKNNKILEWKNVYIKKKKPAIKQNKQKQKKILFFKDGDRIYQ